MTRLFLVPPSGAPVLVGRVEGFSCVELPTPPSASGRGAVVVDEGRGEGPVAGSVGEPAKGPVVVGAT